MLPTIAIFYPGDMGSALATVLRAAGHRVISTSAMRSARTADLCQKTGVVLRNSFTEVVREASIVLSLVPGDAAEQLAVAYAKVAGTAPAEAIYVDLNSIGPHLAVRIGQIVESAGRSFVDGAINGLARNLTDGCTLFLSGAQQTKIAGLFKRHIRTRCLGEQAGRASAMKMLLSGCSKGLCALFTEAALLAEQQGLLPEMMSAYREIYPGVMSVVDRMLPTYAQHAVRRANETAELERTVKAGIDPCIVFSAVRALHDRLAAIDYPDNQQWTVESLIHHLADHAAPGNGRSDTELDEVHEAIVPLKVTCERVP